MAIVVASGTTLSLTTGAESSELITGDNQYVSRGRVQLVAKASAAAATGILAFFTSGGIPLFNGIVPFAGTTGTLSVADNMVVDQQIAGGRLGLKFRNNSAGTLTVDYLVLFTPGR